MDDNEGRVMDDNTGAYIGEVRMFAGNFAPRGWAFCRGQLLPVTGNDAIFSLLGNTFGGNGRTNFGLPNLCESAAVGTGTAAEFDPFALGESRGQKTNLISTEFMAEHTHSVDSSDVSARMAVGTNAPDTTSPKNNYLTTQTSNFYAESTGNSSQHLQAADVKYDVAIENAGSGNLVEINNMGPSLVINYIIALQGMMPARH